MATYEQTTNIDILTLGFTMEETDSLIDSIRNADLSLRYNNANNLNDLNQIFETIEIEIILINCDNSELNLNESTRLIRSLNPSISLILISENITHFTDIAYNLNVEMLIGKQSKLHIILAIKREYQAQQTKALLVETEKRLDEVSKQCINLSEEAREAIAYIHDGMHVYANPSYIKLFGFKDHEDIDGLPVMDLIASTDRELFKALLKKIETKSDIPETKLSCQTEQENILNVSITFSSTTIDSEACTKITVHDLSKEDKFEKRIQELANLDTHTGLYNRKYFTTHLEELLENNIKIGSTLAILQLRIQNFAEIRDTCGLASSDQLLQSTSDILLAITHQELITARFGEHDFTVICIDPSNAKEQSQLLLNKIPLEFNDIPELTIEPVFSIGIAYSDIPNKTNSIYDLLNRVNQANNYAQDNKKNSIIEYTGDLNNTIDDKKIDNQLIGLIDYALNHDGFTLQYQPLVSLKGETNENYAVFVRLINENNEIILPKEFFLPAEEANRLVEIDRWVIHHSIKTISERHKEGFKTNFFINLSLPGLQDDSLLLWICDCLRDFNAKGDWLTFQFKENDILKDSNSVIMLIEGLRKINCSIAIDRFSNTEHSQNTIFNIEPDIIKLSPDLHKAGKKLKPSEYKLLNNYIQSKGIKTAFTEIEEEKMLPLLWDIGVDYIQGHLVQEPRSYILENDSKQIIAS